MKKTRLHRRSKKLQSEMRKYRKEKAEFLEKNIWCEFPASDGRPSCLNRSVDVHHINGREGKKLRDQSNWVAVCRFCHDYIHNNGKEARRLGILK